MSELHIECPHCGASFDVQIDGELSNMMVFPCAKCQTPLMYYHGEISELDRDEFAGLRERLTKVLNVVMRQGSTVNDVADSLKRLVDISNERAEGREQTPAAITDEAIANLEKDLAEMDADSFLNSL
ncbi:hypothetical protein [Fibrobacter sp. UBA4309]|jgi:hypothetical protein|uniref:hypothetical protein n=1 Tax=Fibrobacter sp. UBA4309 TaxID=1946537 RepID=UPI0025BCE6DC|nr:hypothetical protein [Fibrobacter sp. UBA4309]